MGIALAHEVAPHRPGRRQEARSTPRKPNLDEMGPGVESIPGQRDPSGPRSTLGRPGMRGGFKPRRR
jgi:excinuclease ABC subunit B